MPRLANGAQRSATPVATRGAMKRCKRQHRYRSNDKGAEAGNTASTETLIGSRGFLQLEELIYYALGSYEMCSFPEFHACVGVEKHLEWLFAWFAIDTFQGHGEGRRPNFNVWMCFFTFRHVASIGHASANARYTHMSMRSAPMQLCT